MSFANIFTYTPSLVRQVRGSRTYTPLCFIMFYEGPLLKRVDLSAGPLRVLKLSLPTVSEALRKYLNTLTYSLQLYRTRCIVPVKHHIDCFCNCRPARCGQSCIVVFKED